MGNSSVWEHKTLMEKPLILHVRATNFFGGPEKQILEQARRARNYRHSVVSFVDGNCPNELLDRCRDSGIVTHAVLAGNPFNPSSIRQLRRVVTQSAPSLICSHGYRPALLLPPATFGLGIPIAGFLRGHTRENRKVAIYEFLERLVLPRLDGIICVCEAQRQNLRQAGVRSETCYVAYNGVHPPSRTDPGELDRFRGKLGISADRATIVCSGRLSPEKGQRDLLLAIRQIPDGDPACTFLFCGDGPCREALEREVRELGISDRVRFLGHRRDIMNIYQIMDLLVLPSHTEGLPNAILEALSFGKPVVATRVGGLPEIIQDGQSGLLVPPRRPDLLAKAIVRCLASPQAMRSMGENGRNVVMDKFSFDAQCAQLESVYDRILSRRCNAV